MREVVAVDELSIVLDVHSDTSHGKLLLQYNGATQPSAELFAVVARPLLRDQPIDGFR